MVKAIWHRPHGHDMSDAEVLAAAASDLDMEDLSLVDLVEAFKKIVDTVNPSIAGLK